LAKGLDPLGVVPALDCARIIGFIDEVRVCNAVWTASIIRNQYLAGLNQLLANNQITQQEYQQRLADLDSTCAARE
jgi:hypothetical protein